MTKTKETQAILRARGILLTAKEHDIYEPAIPEDQEALVEQAKFVYEQACEAWEGGMQGAAVTAVKFAAEVDGGSNGTSQYEENEEVQEKEEKKEEREDVKYSYDATFEATAFANAKAKKLNLPVPERLEDLPTPQLSHNVVNLTMPELMIHLTDSSLCLAAATWQAAIAKIDKEHAERVGGHYYNKTFHSVVGSAKNNAEAVAESEADPIVKDWRMREDEANATFLSYQSLKEIYKGYYDTVSRIFSMRQEERERG